MDAVQFGQWISKRRHTCGFRSQRAFAENTSTDSPSGQPVISENFLARLEAGQLAHPFRGSVRRRVLAMAWYLCKTPQDVKTYLRAARLSELQADETEQIRLLHQHLGAPQLQQKLPLPPRPVRLFGREHLLQDLLATIPTMHSGVYAITGMPGVGKSVLASAVVHRLAANERVRMRVFPDGIAAFTCSGRQGSSGLIALLDDIITVFDSHPSLLYTSPEEGNADLASSIDRARLVLMNKRVLLLLDDIDAQFPLRQALEAILGQNHLPLAQQGESGYAQRVVLTTGCYIPPPALVTYRLHLKPLEPAAALECFTALLARPLHLNELDDANQLCAALGYLPLALEAAAAAIAVAGIPLPFLAAHAVQHPLDDLLDGEHELRSRLAQAFASFDREIQQRFALLSTLGVPTFGLESAAALRAQVTNNRRSSQRDLATTLPFLSIGQQGRETVFEPYDAPDPACTLDYQEVEACNHTRANGAGDALHFDLSPAQLASAAADLGQLVRHSLVELVPPAEPAAPWRGETTHSIHRTPTYARYQLHPLLYAQSANSLNQFEAEEIAAARRNAQAYAMQYIERYRWDAPRLDRERDFLFASLKQALHTEQYGHVIRLVDGLRPIAYSLPNREDAEHLFLWGIQASRHLHDSQWQTCFMNELGRVYLERGELVRAKQLWTESLEIVASLKQPAPVSLWGALSDLGDLAFIQGDGDAAMRYAEMYLQHYQHSDQAIRAADAHYCYAVYARLEGQLDKAYKSVSSAASMISQLGPMPAHPLDSFIALRVQAELARVQGDYPTSQELIEQAASIIQERANYRLLADLLLEQARFATIQRKHDDATHLAQRVVQLAQQMNFPLFHQLSTQLLRQLADTVPLSSI